MNILTFPDRIQAVRVERLGVLLQECYQLGLEKDPELDQFIAHLSQATTG